MKYKTARQVVKNTGAIDSCCHSNTHQVLEVTTWRFFSSEIPCQQQLVQQPARLVTTGLKEKMKCLCA